MLRCREGLILGGVLGVAERGLVMDCIIVMSREDEKGEGRKSAVGIISLKERYDTDYHF